MAVTSLLTCVNVYNPQSPEMFPYQIGINETFYIQKSWDYRLYLPIENVAKFEKERSYESLHSPSGPRTALSLTIFRLYIFPYSEEVCPESDDFPEMENQKSARFIMPTHNS